jgi:hypothetical protein
MPSLHNILKAFPRLKPVGLFLFALLFLNRALLIAPFETTTSGSEINSVAELLVQWATGQSNGIDEDGDTQETHNSAKTIQPFAAQFFSLSMELQNNILQTTAKIVFPASENFPKLLVYGQIEHPPKIS